MPVIVGDKTLLDAGVSIDSEKLLERVINNGVDKLDVHKSHIGELSKKYPEFYARHQEKVSKAKEAGQARRAKVAEDWAHCRSIVRRPPTITLLAKPMVLPDTSKWLTPFFPIEFSSSSFRDIEASIARTKLIVLRLKGFGDEELDYIRASLRKRPDKVPVLAVVDSFYSGPWDCVRWGGDGASLFRAAFSKLFPEHALSFPEAGIVGFHCESLNRPSVHLIGRENILEEAGRFFEKWPNLDSRISHVDEAQPGKDHVTVFRCPNGDGRLIDDVKTLRANGLDLQNVQILIDEVKKEEVGELSKMGKLRLQLGNLGHQSLEDALLRLTPKSS